MKREKRALLSWVPLRFSLSRFRVQFASQVCRDLRVSQTWLKQRESPSLQEIWFKFSGTAELICTKIDFQTKR